MLTLKNPVILAKAGIKDDKNSKFANPARPSHDRNEPQRHNDTTIFSVIPSEAEGSHLTSQKRRSLHCGRDDNFLLRGSRVFCGKSSVIASGPLLRSIFFTTKFFLIWVYLCPFVV